MELHVFIEVFAPVPEAYMRMAHAMEEIKKFLFPVSTEIRSGFKKGSPEIMFCSEVLSFFVYSAVIYQFQTGNC